MESSSTSTRRARTYRHPPTSAPSASTATGAAAPGPASDYVGTYTSPYFGTLTVTEHDGALQGALAPADGYTFAITPWDGDTMAFSPTGENAPPDSLSSAVFTRIG